MTTRKLLTAFGITLLATCSTLAQQKPGTLASLEFQTPKNGMVKQYEDGRKQKAAWHKEQKDTLPLLVWETISGDHTGTYTVGRLDQHWADLDKPSVPDQADLETYNKLIGASVQTLVIRYYNLLPKASKPPDTPGFTKYSEIFTYQVRPGKEDDFRGAIVRATEAIEKTKWPTHYFWYELVNGGPSGTFVLVIPHANWADFEDKPEMKPFPDMLKDAFGPTEGESLLKRFDSDTASVNSEIIQFRPDLSYLPTK
jgi:hypothetical protein